MVCGILNYELNVNVLHEPRRKTNRIDNFKPVLGEGGTLMPPWAIKIYIMSEFGFKTINNFIFQKEKF